MDKVEKKPSEDRLDRAERILAESAVKAAEERRRAAAESAERDRKHKEDMAVLSREYEEHRAAVERELRYLSREVGGVQRARSREQELSFAEYFRKTKRIGDISLDNAESGVRRSRESREYDLVLTNHNFVFVGELKLRLRLDDVRRFAENRLPYFADEWPDRMAGGRRVIGMVGGDTVDAEAAEEAARLGFIVLRPHHKTIIAENTENAKPLPRR